MKRIHELEKALSASVEREGSLLKLLGRVKKTLEPFPIVGDLKALTNTIKQSRIEDIKKQEALLALHKKYKAKIRKLYKDIAQALKEK